MAEPIDLKTCLIDPPWHRDRIESLERIVNGMDIHVRSIVKHTRAGHEAGQGTCRHSMYDCVMM